MSPELVGRASEIPVVESLLAGIADGESLLGARRSGDRKVRSGRGRLAARSRCWDTGTGLCGGAERGAVFVRRAAPAAAAGAGRRGQPDARPAGRALDYPGGGRGAGSAMPMVGLAALELLTGLAERTPLLVVAEDAHCLDLSTCEVLAFVSRLLGADAVGLLVTARVSELGDNPLAVAGLARAAGVGGTAGVSRGQPGPADRRTSGRGP